MGMVYLFAIVFFLLGLLVLHWLATLFGYPYGYWSTVASLIGAAVLIGFAAGVLKRLTADTRMSLVPDLTITNVEDPGGDYSRDVNIAGFSNSSFEVIPSENYRVAEGPRVFDSEATRITIFRFTDSAGNHLNMANRPAFQ